MLTVNSQTAAEIIKESRHFSAKLVFGSNEYKELDSFVYTSHFSPQSFTIGCLTSASVKCDVRGLPASSASALKGQVFWLKIAVGELISEWISLGEFKITEATKTDGVVSLTAYDKNNFIKGTYSTSLTGSQTVQDVFADICGKIGEDSNGFTAGFKSAESTAKLNVDKLKGYSYKDALSYLAAFAGGCVIVNRQGQFEIRTYSKNDYGLLNNDRIETPKLNEFNSSIGYLSAVLDSENIISAGSTTLSGFSFVCPVMTETRLKTLTNDFTSVSHAVHTFRPGNVTQLLGDPRIEVGDVLPLNPGYDENGTITSAECYIPVMSLVMKYDGGLMSEITAVDFEEDSSLSLAQRIDFAEKSAKKASVYSQAASKLSGLISGGLGMYRTEIVDASGAVKTYIHDQSTLESSSYIVTYDSQGFASTSGTGCWNNGNPTWTNGVTRNGNAVIRTLIANKINVDDIVAQEATIGGWSIIGSRIEKDNTGTQYGGGKTGYRVGIQSYAGSTSAAAFYAGCTTAAGGSTANEDSTSFYVTHAGYLFANNAKIKGNITATSLTLEDCKLSYSSLSGAPDLNVYQRKDGSIIRGNVSDGSVGISISTAGLLQASNAVIYGTVYASAGKIANFTIDGDLLYTGSTNKKTLLRNVSGDDSIVFAAGSAGLESTNIGAAPFYIRNDGSFYASSGTVGGWTVSDSYISSQGSYGHSVLKNTSNSVFLGTGMTAVNTVNGARFLVYHDGTVKCGLQSNSYNFTVDSSGNVTIKGNITAQTGTIAGWTIGTASLLGQTAIYSTAGNYETGMQGSSSETGVAFYVKHRTNGDLFYVKNNGRLYAKDAVIEGDITATSGSFTGVTISGGTIGGFSISDARLWTENKTWGSSGCIMLHSTGTSSTASIGGSASISGWVITAGANFGVTNTGSLYAKNASIEGKITATSGTIGGFNIASGYITTSGGTWGNSGTLMLNSAGSSGKKSIGGSDSKNGWVITAGNMFGVVKDGTLWCSSARINEAIINDSLFNKIDCAGNIDLVGSLRLYRNATDGYAICLRYDSSAVKFGIDTSTLRLYGKNIYLRDTSTAVTSDRRLKSNISDMGDRQEALFNSLIPRTFEYVEGTSGRTHFGFIAQELLTAIEKAHLTTQEVAAYVEMDSEEDGFDGHEYAVRYGEFIALNTYMIQKCLSRISALENEISILKGATT